MKVSKLALFFLIILMSLSMALFMGCGGGDDDDDDSAPVDDDDDDVVDDDDDVVDDDDDTIDDDDDDDTVDDDDDDDYDPNDTDYTNTACALPDPESLGNGDMLGGGAISTTIDVYVYDDSDCSAIQNADVTYAGATVQTDASGYVQLAVVKGAEMVTVSATNYWAWSYYADTAVMYFRLRPDDYGITYNDSSAGDFVQGGATLGLTNPDLSFTSIGQIGSFVADLLAAQIYAGITIPGVSRETILNADFDGFLAQDTFQVEYDIPLKGALASEFIDLPKNIYMPEFTVDIDIVGQFTAYVYGINEQYKVPVKTGTNPIEGAVLNIDLGAVLDGPTLTQLILDLLGGGDVTDALLGLIVPLINDGINFPYIGATPDWDGTGLPDLRAWDIGAKGTSTVTLTGAALDTDYLTMNVAEIPNRALIPMSIGLVDSGSVDLDTGVLQDADYMNLIVKTDLIQQLLSGLKAPLPINVSALATYGEDASDLEAGVSYADADFLPYFDNAATSYDGTTGETTWALVSKGSVDAYFVIMEPAEGPAVFAVLDGSATGFAPPVGDMGITLADATGDPNDMDVVVVIGFDLPSGVDLNAFNPYNIVGYDSVGFNVWTNVDLSELF